MFELVLDVFDVQNQTPTNFFSREKDHTTIHIRFEKINKSLGTYSLRLLSIRVYIYIYIVSNYKQLRNIFLKYFAGRLFLLVNFFL